MAFSTAVEITIVDRFSKRIKIMGNALKNFRGRLKASGTAIQSLGNKMGKMSTRLANLRTGFAATMLVMGLKSIKDEGRAFADAMNAVRARVEPTTAEFIKLGKAARALGRDTKFSSVQAAEGFSKLGERGFDTFKILKTFPNIVAMATAGDLDLAAASSMVTSVMYAFGLQASESSHIADVFAITASNTAASMTDLGAALINVAPLAAAAGLGFDEVSSLIGAMSSKSILGSKAGTLLMNALRNLIGPSNQAIETLKKFGFKKDEVTKASGEIVDMTTLLELFEKRGMGVAEFFKVFQVRGAKAVAALQGQVPVIRKLIALYDEQTGAAGRMSDIMMTGIVGASYEATSAWSDMKLAIALALEPVFIFLLKLVDSFATFIAMHPKLAKFIGWAMMFSAALLTVVTLLGVLLAAGAGVLLLMGPLAAGFAVVTGVGTAGFLGLSVAIWSALWPVLLVQLAVVALIGVIVFMIVYWKELVSWVGGLGDAAIKAVSKFSPLMTVFVALSKLWKGIVEGFKIVSRFFGWGGDETGAGTTKASAGFLGEPNKTIVEVVIKGAIEIKDLSEKTAASPAGGGSIPINVIHLGGYPGLPGLPQ